MRTITLISLFAATSLFFSASSSAGQWNQELKLTFNHPVEIPGHVLAPGTYVFELGVGDTSQDEKMDDRGFTPEVSIFATNPVD